MKDFLIGLFLITGAVVFVGLTTYTIIYYAVCLCKSL